VTLPPPALSWSGGAGTTAVQVRGPHEAIANELDTPEILPFQPGATPWSEPRAIVTCVPPPVTETLMMRPLFAELATAGGGVGSLGGRGPRGCFLMVTTAVWGGLYLAGVSSLSGTCASVGMNATCAGKSLLTSAGAVAWNDIRMSYSAESRRPWR